MTHQYKQMQKEYQDELDELTATINIRSTELCNDNHDVEKNNENINETRKQQDIKLKAKETEIK